MRDKIMTFLDITSINKFPDLMTNSVIEQVTSNISTAGPETIEKATVLMRSALDANKHLLIDTIVSAYRDAFTDEQINELVAFYEGSTGKRIVELGGVVLPAVIEAGHTWSTDVLKGIESEMNALFVEQSAQPQPQPSP